MDIMDTTSATNILSYAANEVPTHKRRTAVGTLLRWLGALTALLLLVVRLVFLAIGYVIIGIGQVSRLIFGALGAIMLLLGGLRWHEVKHRLMGGAIWVDRITLRMVRAVSRNPFAQPVHSRSL